MLDYYNTQPTRTRCDDQVQCSDLKKAILLPAAIQVAQPEYPSQVFKTTFARLLTFPRILPHYLIYELRSFDPFSYLLSYVNILNYYICIPGSPFVWVTLSLVPSRFHLPLLLSFPLLFMVHSCAFSILISDHSILVSISTPIPASSITINPRFHLPIISYLRCSSQLPGALYPVCAIHHPLISSSRLLTFAFHLQPGTF